MYAYAGTRGSVIDEISVLDKNHLHSINKKFLLRLGSPLFHLQQALAGKSFEGPIFEDKTEEIVIYAARVHTINSVQYRIPFAPLGGGYIVLNYDTRSDIDFKKLAYEALIRYREAKNQNAYVEYPSSTYRPPISYR
jgi:hypothetical protein